MAGQAKDIIDANWTELQLLPESIPHLLHWDLAYLWVLERAPDVQPETWRTRVEAWRRLLCLFLLGELEVRSVALEAPLLGFCEPFGIDTVEELHYRGALIGVMSNTVLVRPLPGASDEALKGLPDLATGRASELSYFVNLLSDLLHDHAGQEGDREPQRALSEIVRRVRDRLAAGLPAGDQQWRAKSIKCKLLRTLTFGEDAAVNDSFPVFVSEQQEMPLFVPRCETCRKLLTRPDIPGENIVVTGHAVSLVCPDAHVNTVPLEKFMIWIRGDIRAAYEIIYWTNRERLAPFDANQKFPPPPQPHDSELHFHWPSSSLGGETVKTSLRFAFQATRIAPLSIAQAFYEKVLIPGADLKNFKALPVRAAWTDAIASPGRVIPDPSSIKYDHLQIKGWPFPFNWHVGSLRMSPDPDVGLAIYPRRMHPEWKQYRIVAVGNNGQEYRVLSPDASGHVDFVQDVPGWPQTVTLESSDGTTGATWYLSGEDIPAPGPVADICMGVDFGTTNTVVYFQEQNTDASLKSERNAVSVDDFKKLVHWVHPAAPHRPQPGWFLPLPPAGNQDPYLIPSALWDLGGAKCVGIRWNKAAPSETCQARHGFKWDEHARDYRELRRRYLQELFFFCVPAMMNRIASLGSPANLSIGFSYPLAFAFQQRDAFKALLSNLQAELRASTGMGVSVYSINESLASVRAFGAPNPGEMFLVADLGGRTLDVALFRYQSDSRRRLDAEHLLQIGSVEFGGEMFLECVAYRQTGSRNPEVLDPEYWKIRDGLARSAEGAGAPDQSTLRLLDRFQPMALEFLRSMLESYFHDAGDQPPIKVLLVGNGWRLRELAAYNADPRRVTRDYFLGALEKFGDPRVGAAANQVDGIRSSKHWVACGALASARLDHTHELDQEEFPSRLPAGRDLTTSAGTVRWHQLVGQGGWRHSHADEDVRHGTIECDYNSGPVPSASWRAVLNRAVRPERRYPTPEKLRDQILRSLRNSRLEKGPLTLILESHWSEQLWED